MGLLCRAPDMIQFAFLDRRKVAFKETGCLTFSQRFEQELPMDPIEEEPSKWNERWQLKSADSHDAMTVDKQRWLASGCARRELNVVVEPIPDTAAGLIFGQAKCGLCGNA